mmetsp:Transcript_75685/g.125750  ORF Transcript_75685/g.125750 Transcript_75685/m.125750 type:complete len:92 (-) Transcript_75685:9-284(-)
MCAQSCMVALHSRVWICHCLLPPPIAFQVTVQILEKIIVARRERLAVALKPAVKADKAQAPLSVEELVSTLSLRIEQINMYGYTSNTLVTP